MRNKTRLRKFPYPFRAALTISNDNHTNCTLKEFTDVHRFLNSEEDTPLGRGVGLEIADSFWFFSANPNRTATYFKGLSTEPSDFAPLFRQYIRAGYIDTLHTYGDFSTPGVFHREFAVQAISEMQAQNLRIPVWVNHGNQHNVQNLNRGISHHQGAMADSHAYHSDLTIRAGFKFYWNSQLTPVIGQGRRVALTEYVNIDYKSPLLTCLRIARAYVGANGFRSANGLLFPLELDDGKKVYAFPRFNNHENIWRGVSNEDLGRQLGKTVLDRLVAEKGYMIVYNHLLDHLPFGEAAIMALQSVSDEFKSGRILVASTSRLLWYYLLNGSVRWSEEQEADGRLILRIAPILIDDVLGEIPLDERELMGLTFYTSHPDKVSIYVGNKLVEDICTNPPDETGQASISIPWRPLKFSSEELAGN